MIDWSFISSFYSFLFITPTRQKHLHKLYDEDGHRQFSNINGILLNKCDKHTYIWYLIDNKNMS